MYTDGYNASANGLWEATVKRLSEIQTDLSGRMDAVAAQDRELLKSIEAQHRKISGTLSSSSICFDFTDSQTGESCTEKVNVGERVACVRRHLDALESEIEDLWGLWEEAQVQVTATYEALTGGNATANSTPALEEASESLKRDMEEYEMELDELIDQAAEAMRESEKVSHLSDYLIYR